MRLKVFSFNGLNSGYIVKYGLISGDQAGIHQALIAEELDIDNPGTGAVDGNEIQG
jgi:hypothetical protein